MNRYEAASCFTKAARQKEIIAETGRARANIDAPKVVEHWFTAAEQSAGLILPDGWFGRPYDNIYFLTKAEVANSVLVIRLDGETTLRFDNPSDVAIRNSELVINGFASLDFRWKEFGGTEYHEKHFDSGQVRFIPPLGTTITPQTSNLP